jgi:hypothetical protein
MVLAEAWDWMLGLNAGVYIVHSNLRMNCRCGWISKAGLSKLQRKA